MVDFESENKVLHVIKIASREAPDSWTDHDQTERKPILTNMVKYQAIIMHQDNASRLHPVTEDYPMPLIKMANLPLIYYQIRYLECNSLHDIYIVIENEFRTKVEKYLKEYFSDCKKSNIHLVVLQTEDESANTLKLLKKHLKDEHALTKDLVIMDGSSLAETSLDFILEDHYRTKASITSLVKEQDLQFKPKQSVQNETYDIYGISDLKIEDQECIEVQRQNPTEVKRLILKANNLEAVNTQISAKKSVLKKAKQIIIRTDLTSMGIYIIQNWLVQFLMALDEEHDIHFSSLSEEFLPFLAKHQFKSVLKKFYNKHHSRSYQISSEEYVVQKMDQIMNPEQVLSHNDFFKMHVCIDKKQSNYFINLQNTSFYTSANFELLRILKLPQEQDSFITKIIKEGTFSECITDNSKPGEIKVLDNQDEAVEQEESADNKNKIKDSSVFANVTFGDNKVSISGSCIGRNVTIGKRSKISSSIILNNVVIGDDVIIQNSLILSKCKINDNQFVKDIKLESGRQM